MKPLSILLFSALAMGQGRLTPGTGPFVTVNAPVVELQHVRVIDGTGAAPLENQTIVIDHGKIATMGPAASTPAPPGAQVMDLTGHTRDSRNRGNARAPFLPFGRRGTDVYRAGFQFSAPVSSQRRHHGAHGRKS